MIAAYTQRIMDDLTRHGRAEVYYGGRLTAIAARTRIVNAANRLNLPVSVQNGMGDSVIGYVRTADRVADTLLDEVRRLCAAHYGDGFDHESELDRLVRLFVCLDDEIKCGRLPTAWSPS